MLLKFALEIVLKELRSCDHIKNPNLEAKQVIKHITSFCDTDIILHLESYDLSVKEIHQLMDCVKARTKGIPLAYIINSTPFWKDNFYIDDSVLVPRADSEIIVEAVLDQVKDDTAKLELLDIGTGSGCLAISLLKEYINSNAIALDVSEKALTVASKNARNLGVNNRVEFIKSSLFTKLNPIVNKFDIIVSNPPYISKEDKNIDYYVKKYEPNIALFASSNGMWFYENIIPTAHKFLKEDALLVMEVGHEQKEDVVSIIEETNLYKNIKVYKDNSGIERVISANKKQ